MSQVNLDVMLRTLLNTKVEILIHNMDQDKQRYHEKDRAHMRASWPDREQLLLSETSDKKRTKKISDNLSFAWLARKYLQNVM